MKEITIPIPKHREIIKLSKDKPVQSVMIVPSYQVNEQGKTICVPVPEHSLKRCTRDGVSFEISNLMFGTLPETLGQIQLDDAMVTAEKITTECVRRFGKLSEQRQKLVEKFNQSKNEE